MKPLLLTATLLVSACSFKPVHEWPIRDQVLLAANLTCQTVDTAQTLKGLAQGFREGNPNLTHFGESRPAVLASKLAIEGAWFYAALWSPDEWRWAVLAFDLAQCAYAVEGNFRLGVGWGF